MLPDERDAGLLWSMVRRARYLVRKAGSITLDELLREEDHQFAVAKALELMGEAVRHLSEGFCKAASRGRVEQDQGNETPAGA
jgi:uncharacterized protein with HEPN domain